jgi:hypothetical protein
MSIGEKLMELIQDKGKREQQKNAQRATTFNSFS